MAKRKQQDGSISLQVVKPLSREASIHSRHFPLSAAVALVGPNVWAPTHWALTGTRSEQVGLVLLQTTFASAARSAPSQVSKQDILQEGGRSSLLMNSTQKWKLALQCRHWAQRAYCLHWKWSPAKSLPSHSTACFTWSSVCSQRQPHSKDPLHHLTGYSPHLRDLEDSTQLVELANSFTLFHHWLTLQLFIDVVFKVEVSNNTLLISVLQAVMHA